MRKSSLIGALALSSAFALALTSQNVKADENPNSVNETFINHFNFGEKFIDEDGVNATRDKVPDVELRFKPKGYEKTVTRKINFRNQSTGETLSRIYQSIRYYGTYEYEIPNDAPVNDVPEAEIPVVSEKGTPEVHEKPEFSGGVVPLDPPALDVPEAKIPEPVVTEKGVPEVHEKPEAKIPVMAEKGVPEVNEKPEAKIPVIVEKGVPEVHEKPEAKIPEPEKNKTPEPKQSEPKLRAKTSEPKVEKPVKTETKAEPKVESPTQQDSVKTLPNTGSNDNRLLTAFGLTLLSSVTAIASFFKFRHSN